jgi:hypothetical protein
VLSNGGHGVPLRRREGVDCEAVVMGTVGESTSARVDLWHRLDPVLAWAKQS